MKTPITIDEAKTALAYPPAVRPRIFAILSYNQTVKIPSLQMLEKYESLITDIWISNRTISDIISPK